MRTLETINAEHLEIFTRYAQVLARKGEKVTEQTIIDFIKRDFPRYRDHDPEFLYGIACFVLA